MTFATLTPFADDTARDSGRIQVPRPSAGALSRSFYGSNRFPYLVAGFWALASREEGRFDTPVRAVTLLVGGLSTATQAILLRWAIVVAVRRRVRRCLEIPEDLARASLSRLRPRWLRDLRRKE